MRKFSAFLQSDSGATAIEYALLGTLIAIALVGTFTVFGDVVANLMGAGTGGAGNVIQNSANSIR